MKKIFLTLMIGGFLLASCGNEADNANESGTDSTNSIILPENRSSDSAALRSDTSQYPNSTMDSVRSN